MHLEEYGNTLKRIRKSKNMTQKDMSNNIISKSNYAKIETNEIDTSIRNFHLLLERVDMDYEDFLTIHLNKSQNKKKVIFEMLNGIHLFDSYKDSYKLLQLVCLDYISENCNDKTVQDIDKLLTIIISYSSGNIGNFEANKQLKDLWIKYERMSEWFYTDLSIVRLMLFFFPKKQYEVILKSCLSTIKNYGVIHNKKYEQLKISTLITAFSKSLSVGIEFEIFKFKAETISLCKRTGDYKSLGIIYILCGIALCEIDQDEYELNIEKGIKLLSLVDEINVVLDIYSYYKNLINLKKRQKWIKLMEVEFQLIVKE